MPHELFVSFEAAFPTAALWTSGRALRAKTQKRQNEKVEQAPRDFPLSSEAVEQTAAQPTAALPTGAPGAKLQQRETGNKEEQVPHIPCSSQRHYRGSTDRATRVLGRKKRDTTNSSCQRGSSSIAIVPSSTCLSVGRGKAATLRRKKRQKVAQKKN